MSCVLALTIPFFFLLFFCPNGSVLPPHTCACRSEENLLTIKAQVYYLDQASQNWTPATFTVIPVGFWYEAPPAHRTRIIGLENNEVRPWPLCQWDAGRHSFIMAPSYLFGSFFRFA